jgi:Do/DeqQ family serine protease
VRGQFLPSLALAPLLEKATPAVVNISSSTKTRISDNPLFNDPFFLHFFNISKQKQEKQSRGSGVIIDARNGYVVTSHHLIEKANKIFITLLDGRQFDADLIGMDPETNIALLKVPVDYLTALPLADSEHLRVGDFVIAIGNPFGSGQTVTSGIISALGRSSLGIEGYEDFIQTDASINPGNLGGALVNLRGELIGINMAIIAQGGENVGISFAIPSNMVNKIVQHLVEFGEVQRGTLGIRIQDLTPDLANAFGLNGKKGALIAQVEPGTPAEKAGLREGDLIIAVNNKQVSSATELRNHIGLLRIGERVKITLIRKGRIRHLYARIADNNQVEGGNISLYLDGALLKDTPNGIQVYKVTQNSNAWKVGFRQGDIIMGFNRRKIKDLDDLTHRFKKYTSRSIQIYREGNTLSLRLN